MSQGWILLHRQLQECWIWNDKPYSKGQAWVDLLLSANHKEKKLYLNGELKIIQRGQFHTSLRKLADRWGWNVKTVKKFLNLLENDKMIYQECSRVGNTITIEKYSIYQDLGNTDYHAEYHTEGNTEGNTEGHTVWTQTNNEKKEKNVKNEKNIKDVFGPDEELEIAFKDFSDMRKKIKKPLTPRATTLIINKLEKLSYGDNRKAIDILNQSILKGWQDVYPLKIEEQPKSDFMDALQEAVKRKEAQNVNSG